MLKTVLAGVLALAFAYQANATTIFDPSKVAAAQEVIDFDGFGTLADASPSFTFANGLGTLATSGISFSTAGAFTFGNTGVTNLGINGRWGNPASYLSFDAIGTMTLNISFGGKTTRSFGANWSLYEEENDLRSLTVQAFDKGGKLLESFTTARDGVDIDDNSLVGSRNSSFFQGIRRKQADIATISITGDRIVMDNFTFTTPVPEPEGYAMFLAGIGLMGIVTRRRSGH